MPKVEPMWYISPKKTWEVLIYVRSFKDKTTINKNYKTTAIITNKIHVSVHSKCK